MYCRYLKRFRGDSIKLSQRVLELPVLSKGLSNDGMQRTRRTSLPHQELRARLAADAGR